MKIWNFLKRKLRKKKKVEVAPIVPEVPTEYDYGLGEVRLFLASNDYGWNEPDKSQKKVILTNPKDCEKKITVTWMVSAWRGTGHAEWEVLLGAWFVQAITDALKENRNEADITHLFDRDLVGSRGRIFTRAQVYAHLIKWFTIVEETDEVMKLRFRI